jgi:hypothetical protein
LLYKSKGSRANSSKPLPASNRSTPPTSKAVCRGPPREWVGPPFCSNGRDQGYTWSAKGRPLSLRLVG